MVINIPTTLRDAERELIEATLQHTGGNISLAAKLLGIDRSTLYSKMRRNEMLKT